MFGSACHCPAPLHPGSERWHNMCDVRGEEMENELYFSILFPFSSQLFPLQELFAIHGAALTPSGARLAAGGPLGGSPDAGCVPRKPASSSSSRNLLQKLQEKLLERPVHHLRSLSGVASSRTRGCFHIWENTAGRDNGKAHPERGSDAERTTNQ